MIIFDLDGTLADCEHRRHFIDRDSILYKCVHHPLKPCDECKKKHRDWKPDWQAFYEACDQDNPIEPVVEIFHNLHAQEQEVQIWSGRCESVREKTYQWLLDNIQLKYITAFCPERDLKMRPIGDNTPDDVLKERWLDEYLALPTMDIANCPNANKIEFVFDDSETCCNMWRRRGVFVFNCCQHDGEF